MKFHTVNKAMYQSLNLKIENILHSGSSLSPMLFSHLLSPNYLPYLTHHQLSGHEYEQTPRDSKGQGSLVCCSPWGCKELDTV